MNDSTQPNASDAHSMSAFIPLILLAVSLALFLTSQISNLLTQRTNLKELNTKLVEARDQRDKALQQAPKVQERLQKLFLDLAAIAKDDKDAQAIISRSGIQLNPNPAPAAPDAPAAPVTPAPAR